MTGDKSFDENGDVGTTYGRWTVKDGKLVEQNARKGLSAAHRGYVLESGQNRLTGSGRNLLEDPEVQRLYLGG